MIELQTGEEVEVSVEKTYERSMRLNVSVSPIKDITSDTITRVRTTSETFTSTRSPPSAWSAWSAHHIIHFAFIQLTISISAAAASGVNAAST